MIDVYGIKLENKNFKNDLQNLPAEQLIDKYGIELTLKNTSLKVTENGDPGANGPVCYGKKLQPKLAEIMDILKSRS
jgi:hypothetical protein